MKEEWIYLQEPICHRLTAQVCAVAQLWLSKLAASVIVHGAGPHQHP